MQHPCGRKASRTRNGTGPGITLTEVRNRIACNFLQPWIKLFRPKVLVLPGPKVAAMASAASVCAVVGCGPGMGGSAAIRFAKAGYKIAGMCRTADTFQPTEDPDCKLQTDTYKGWCSVLLVCVLIWLGVRLVINISGETQSDGCKLWVL